MSFATLMHKNDKVASLQFNDDLGVITGVKCHIPEMMPFMREMSLIELEKWWNERAIPQKRAGLSSILKEYNCDNTRLLLYKNLALSLTDTYWIRPSEMDLTWEMVNLFDHSNRITFTGEDGREFSNSPIGSLNGSLAKEAEFKDGKWRLVKYSESPNGQQSINEAFACLMHKKQKFTEYTDYTLNMDKGKCKSCVCDFFTSPKKEYVPAWYIYESQKKDNNISAYEHYLKVCSEHKINETAIRKAMDYMTLSDFVITNDDRHLQNFGILRDPDTMNFIKPAPIFDSGNSMFRKNLYNMKSSEILEDIEITALYDREYKLLQYIKNKDIVSLDKLPKTEEVLSFYVKYGMPESVADIISRNYQKKIEMIELFQDGKKINPYFMKQVEKRDKSISIVIDKQTKNENMEKQDPKTED